MNEELNRKLDKKLAEWAGVGEYFASEKQPDGSWKPLYSSPFFASSLDACFKWLVPPIENKGLTLSYVSFRQASGRHYAEWRIYREKDRVKCGECLAMDWQEGTDLAEITALALCKAIEKIIDSDT